MPDKRKGTIPPSSGQGRAALFKGGALIEGATLRGRAGKHKRGKRRAIVQWSAASRRRLRLALLTLTGPEGWPTIGLTFTVPGPELPHGESRELWRTYCRDVDRAKLAMIWRVEVQQRGALHWHAIGTGEGEPGLVAYRFEETWRDVVNGLGVVEHTRPDWKYIVQARRMGLPGADKHAFHANIGGDAERGAWLRYLQDHASKAKQEQVPESIGRHWGIVGRSRWRKATPAGRIDLPPRAWARYLRAIQRMATPSKRDDSKPFGRVLLSRNRRGRYGRSVWFGNPETHRKIAAWALQDAEPGPISRPSGSPPGR
jgi:hypothetical protein